LRPKPYPGAERLYAVVTSWRHTAFENLARRLHDARSSADVAASAVTLVNRLDYEQQFSDDIRGFAFGMLELHNESAPTVAAMVEQP
jgi:hypothetical protein